MPNKNIHDISQSDVLLNENSTRNTYNNEATIVQGPTGDDDEIKITESVDNGDTMAISQQQ